MPTNLVGHTEMPGFSVLGMLLGGRGYAANYFAQKDALALEEAQRQERGEFATGYVNSPEMAAAVKDPQRLAEYNLWKRGQFGPDDIAGTTNSILVNRLQDMDSVNRMHLQEGMNIRQSQLDNQLATGRIELQHKYGLDETRFSTDERIRAEDQIRKNAAIAAQQETAALLGGMEGQNKQNTIYDLAAEKWKLPKRGANENVVAGPDGTLKMVPGPGSERYEKATQGLQNLQQLGGSLAQLSDMMDNDNVDFAKAGVLRQLAEYQIKQAYELGALDAQQKEANLNLLSVYGLYQGYGKDPRAKGIARERLRVMSDQNNRNIEAWGFKFGRDPNQEPNPYYKSQIKPKPEGPAVIPTAIERRARTREEFVPAGERGVVQQDMNFPGSKRRQ